MSVIFNLPSLKSEKRDHFINRPIELSFEIPYFTVSGILIRYLKIEEKSNYTANPFVRYISKNGKYYIRTNYNNKGWSNYYNFYHYYKSCYDYCNYDNDVIILIVVTRYYFQKLFSNNFSKILFRILFCLYDFYNCINVYKNLLN